MYSLPPKDNILKKIFRGRNSCCCFCVELVKPLFVHQYSVDIFSCFSPSGILGSDGKQNIDEAGDKGRENCCTFR